MIKKILLIIGILVLLPGWCWGSVLCAKPGFYKVGDCSNCLDLEGWTAGDLEAAVGLAGNGGTLYLCDDTYYGTDLDSDSGFLIDKSDFLLSACGDGVILDSSEVTTNHSIVVNRNNISIKGPLKIYSPPDDARYGIYINTSLTGGLIENVEICNGNNGIYSKGAWIGNRLYIHDLSANGIWGNHADSLFTINSSVIENTKKAVLAHGGSSAILNNTNISKVSQNFISAPYTDVHTIIANNCILSGKTVSSYSAVDNNAEGGGTCVLNNCRVTSDGINPESMGLINTTANNCFYDLPKYTHTMGIGIVILGVDDTAGADYISSLAQKAYSYGYSVTWGLHSADIATYTSYPDIAALINNYGVDISSHGYSDNRLDVEGTGINAIVLTHPAGTASFSIVRSDASNSATWYGTLSLSTGEDLSIYGDPGNANFKTIQNVIDWVNIQDSGNWDAVLPSGIAYGRAKAVCLDSFTSESCIGGYTATWDQTAYLHVEIDENIEALEAGIQTYIPSFKIETHIYSIGYHDETIRDYIKNYGLLAARAGEPADCDHDMEDLELYYIRSKALSEYHDADGSGDENDVSDAELKNRINSMIDWITANNAVCYFHSHGSSDFTLSQWDIFFDVLSKSNAIVLNFTDAAKYLRGSLFSDTLPVLPTPIDYDDHGLIDAETERILRDGTNGSGSFPNLANYLLQPSSPCVNSGTIPFVHGDGDQTDYAGNPVWSDTVDDAVGLWGDGPDIGAYGYNRPAVNRGVSFQ
jgi:hypothetical protein